MTASVRKNPMRCAAWAAMTAILVAATPVSADLIESTADVPMRKQLCARLSVDGYCLDGSSKLDELLPSSDPIVELPPVQELLPTPVEVAAVVPTVITPVPEPSAAFGLLLLAAAGFAARRSRLQR